VSFLALAKGLGLSSIAALICSSRLVEGESGLVATALDDWVASRTGLAGGFTIEIALDGV